LPTCYNPDARGARKKIEPEKWRVTMVELERLFSGYQRMHIAGWNREDRVHDDLYRFEIDVIVTRAKADAILRWRQTLERRFAQRSIYMRCFEPTFWL
jgi:ribonucleotide reductase beta subunit family protein with ferritin-like domain